MARFEKWELVTFLKLLRGSGEGWGGRDLNMVSQGKPYRWLLLEVCPGNSLPPLLLPTEGGPTSLLPASHPELHPDHPLALAPALARHHLRSPPAAPIHPGRLQLNVTCIESGLALHRDEFILLSQPPDGKGIDGLTLQTGTLRSREINQLAQGHAAAEW